MTSLGRTPSPLTPIDPGLRGSPSTGQKTATPTSANHLSRAEAIGRYRTGMLDVNVPLALSSSNSATTRRPRAGTMPSTFTLGTDSSGLMSPSEGLHSPLALDNINTMPHLGLGGGSLSVPGSGGNTPMTDVGGHTLGPYFGEIKASASASDLVNSKSRARAGTVALPFSVSNSSFGRGLFGDSFVPRPTTRMNEEIRSVKSDDDDERNHINTLDYLGLETDSPISPPTGHATLPNHPLSAQSSSFQEQDTFKPSDMANLSTMAGRMRASTVSGLPPRLPPLIRRTSPIPDQAYLQVDSSITQSPSDGLHFANTLRGRLSGGIKSADPTAPDSHWLFSQTSSPVRTPTLDQSPERVINPLLHQAGNSPTNRPRASTLAAASLLGGPLSPGALGAVVAARARAGTLASMNHPGFLGLNGNNLTTPNLPESTLNASALGFVPSSAEGSLQSQAWQSISRPLTPDATQQHAFSPATQQPSRSLWIGNLDAGTSAQELMTVFSVYGAIQSLRLLPEKECGFVNFVSLHNAVHAKDDVLNRLGGQISLRNGPVQVRIGFGNPESAPPTPSSALPGVAGQNGPPTPSAMGESPLQSSPTRALWVGSIPSQTTPNHLMDIFAPFGPVESARVLTHKNCGFINFEHLDDAVRARKALNGRELLGSDIGAIKIGYAKAPIKTGSFNPGPPIDAIQTGTPPPQSMPYDPLGRNRISSGNPHDQQIHGGGIPDYRPNMPMNFLPSGVPNFAGMEPPLATPFNINTPIAVDTAEALSLLKGLSGDEGTTEAEEHAISEYRPAGMYFTSIPPPVNTDDPHRRFAMSDASRLRDIRKKIDLGTLSQEDVDQIAKELLEEIVYLSSDYIGNTIVQKLFERCSSTVKFLMLERIAPHLAVIGCHKNGTWAAQKIIDCARTPEEMDLICQSLKPFTPLLLLDPLGNYVVQGVLRFGSPNNDFAFDAMVDRTFEIAQGRFGARSVRTCLESQHTTSLQIKKVAIAIIINSVLLATNPNGALLLTWLLDTSNLQGRYRLLAPRLASQLPQLCIHKLASLTILRIINQKYDPEAVKVIINALFHSPKPVLEEVLADQVHGITVIQKILTSSTVDPDEKPLLQESVREVLTSLRYQHVPAYRKLAEELGMTGLGVAANQTPGATGLTPPRAISTLNVASSPWPSPSGPNQNPNFTSFNGMMPSMAPNIARSPSKGPPSNSVTGTAPNQATAATATGMPISMHLQTLPTPTIHFPRASSPLTMLGGPNINGTTATPTAPHTAVAGSSFLQTPMSGVHAPPQLGSPDPFSALRYPQPFSFTPHNHMAPQQLHLHPSVGAGDGIANAGSGNNNLYGTKGVYEGDVSHAGHQLSLHAAYH